MKWKWRIFSLLRLFSAFDSLRFEWIFLLLFFVLCCHSDSLHLIRFSLFMCHPNLLTVEWNQKMCEFTFCNSPKRGRDIEIDKSFHYIAENERVRKKIHWHNNHKNLLTRSDSKLTQISDFDDHKFSPMSELFFVVFFLSHSPIWFLSFQLALSLSLSLTRLHQTQPADTLGKCENFPLLLCFVFFFIRLRSHNREL